MKHVDPESANEFIEGPKASLTTNIRIEKLYKRYGNSSVVNGIDLNIYEGQLTVLLGHNGAGKTTILNMITGLVRPTDGKIYIGKNNIKKGLINNGVSLGVCLQHNLLFPDLTVEEHLVFFAMVRNRINYSEIN